jgi:hypothetical protein
MGGGDASGVVTPGAETSLVHIVCSVEDARHYFITRHKVVGFKGVDDTLFSLAEGAGVRDATQHEEAEVVGVNGCGAINHLAILIVVIERLPHEVDTVTEGLSMRLSSKDMERAKDRQSRRSHMISHAAVAQSGRAGETHFIAWSARSLALVA